MRRRSYRDEYKAGVIDLLRGSATPGTCADAFELVDPDTDLREAEVVLELHVIVAAKRATGARVEDWIAEARKRAEEAAFLIHC